MKNAKLYLLPILIVVTVHMPSKVDAVEGFWIPLLLEALNEGEMQSMGMELTAEDIYSINQGSLKDAIVHFGGFCSSELISDQGLLLTNHHCGYGQIQSHSSTENNYLRDGFWAADQASELANPGLTATFIDRIIDVSDAVLRGVHDQMDEAERQSQIDKNIDSLRRTIDLQDYQKLLVRPFYYGNQYFAFVTVTYSDVRLVGAPPESIGKFGADTDNWVWPRHTGDFALFRIYAGADNLPAEYSPSNQPYRPKHYLPVSVDGVEEGDFTMVFGFPGRTQEYLPAAGVQQIIDVVNPTRISLRDQALEIMDEYMRSSEEIKIQYASKFARIANGWKKWIGESQGLKSKKAVAKKKSEEEEFDRRIRINPRWNEPYRDLLPQMEQAYADLADYRRSHEYYMETFYRNTEVFRFASQIRKLHKTLDENGEDAWRAEIESKKDGWMSFFKDYNPTIDKEIARALSMALADNVAPEHLMPSLSEIKADRPGAEAKWDQFFDESHLTHPDRLEALLSVDADSFEVLVQRDPLLVMESQVQEYYGAQISPSIEQINDRLALLQRRYMEAQMKVFGEKRFYPDANGTMRVSYGQMQGYKPRDAVQYDPQTYLEGVMEKYVPGDYEFDVSPRLVELYESKDYGIYGEDGKMPVCFLGSNHTTGGNSGSPVIDGEGNLIGINFDRTWEGTMSDLNYDVSICRNIMVDVRYMLFIIDKYADSKWIVDEMTLVGENIRPQESMDSAGEKKRPMKKRTSMESMQERRPAVEKE